MSTVTSSTLKQTAQLIIITKQNKYYDDGTSYPYIHFGHITKITSDHLPRGSLGVSHFSSSDIEESVVPVPCELRRGVVSAVLTRQTVTVSLAGVPFVP